MYQNHFQEKGNQKSYPNDISLPKLPPLNTRRSFLDEEQWIATENNSNNNRDHSRRHKSHRYHKQLPKLPTESIVNIGSPRNLKMRRPPPPQTSVSGPAIADSTRNLFSPTSPITTRSPIHRSPFVGEDEARDSIGIISPSSYNHKYQSPFIGDTESQVIVTPSTEKSSESYIEDSTSSNFSRLVSQMNIDYTDPTSITDLEPLDDAEYYRKPPPRISGIRDISNISKISDSIESYYSDSNYTFNNSNARHSSFNSLLGGKPLELAPSITAPTQRFSVDNLDENKLYQCYTTHRLSDIYEWILKIYFEWFNEYIFGKFEFYQVVQRLLEFQLPSNFEQDVIDSNVDRIIASLIQQNAVRFELDPNDTSDDKDITIIVAGLDVQGILTELLPCYSFADTAYEQSSSTLCYSLICANRSSTNHRETRKISEIIHKSVGLWTDYWKLTSEELADINPREIQRQSFIFDLIILEERSLNMANAAVEIYGKRYKSSLLPDEPNFDLIAFDVFQPLIKLHKDYLLDPIFWKIKTNGKFIDGIGKIYSKWCSEAKGAYLNYATAMATVHEVITWEKRHDTKFAHWLNDIDNSPEITRSKMYHDVIFFGGFFKSLQNMPITLSSILKNTDKSNEDYDYLKSAIKEIEKLSADVDRVHGEAIDHRNLVRFSKQIVYISSLNGSSAAYINVSSNQEMKTSEYAQDQLYLGLSDPERRLLISGQLMKKRELWIEPLPVYLALLDNYLLITEPIIKNNTRRYKLIERPIPIEYLNLEQKVNDPNFSTSNLNTTSSRTVNHTPSTPIRSSRPPFVGDLIYNRDENADTSRRTGISNINPGDIELSFKIRNTATSESFTFLTANLSEKERWINMIIESFKNKKNRNKPALNFKVLSTQFAYSDKDAPVNLPLAPEGSEIDEALKEYSAKTGNKEKYGFPMVTSIQSATYLYFENQCFFIIATENGIFMRIEDDTDSKFVKIIQSSAVRAMEVNEKLGLFFVLDSKNLCYFNIPSILGAFYDRRKYLEGNLIVGIVVNDKVSCFKFAEDFGNSRHLLYERKGKVHVLTPEFDQLTKNLKYFKEYKEYKLPTSTTSISGIEANDITVFKKSFIVHTSKGPVLFHDEFDDDGFSLPSFLNDKPIQDYLNSSHLANGIFKTIGVSSNRKESSKLKMAEYVRKDIATNKTKSLECFQIMNTKNYLLIYDEAVIRLNSHGEIADWRNDILVLDFHCTGSAMYNGYLVLVGDNLIQIYNLKSPTDAPGNLNPIQIIKGKKVQLINSEKKNDVILSLSHPNIPNRQLLLTCNINNTT